MAGGGSTPSELQDGVDSRVSLGGRGWSRRGLAGKSEEGAASTAAGVGGPEAGEGGSQRYRKKGSGQDSHDRVVDRGSNAQTSTPLRLPAGSHGQAKDQGLWVADAQNAETARPSAG